MISMELLSKHLNYLPKIKLEKFEINHLIYIYDIKIF